MKDQWITANLEIGRRTDWLTWRMVQYMSLNIIRDIKFESTRCPAWSGIDLLWLMSSVPEVVALRSSWRWWTGGRIDWLIDWLSMVLRLRQHNIGYTADGFCRSDEWPSQQCQSTEGWWLVIQTGLNLTMFTSPCYNTTTCMPILYKTII